MKVLFAAAASAIMAGSLFSAEALKPASVADFTGYTKSAKNIENGIRFTGTRFLSYKSVKSIPVDLKKKYRISGSKDPPKTADAIVRCCLNLS